jgi:hypothetical protein
MGSTSSSGRSEWAASGIRSVVSRWVRAAGEECLHIFPKITTVTTFTIAPNPTSQVDSEDLCFRNSQAYHPITLLPCHHITASPHLPLAPRPSPLAPRSSRSFWRIIPNPR